MLLVQDYMRSGKTLEDLFEDHGVKTHETNGKICFNYDQLAARESDPLAQQCRGLVLRKDTWDIVACPMFRFFNLEQKELAADIDWTTAQFEEKMDGSCLIVYWDEVDQSWHCGTRGHCEADAIAHDSDMTFRQLFDTTVRQTPIEGAIISDIPLGVNFLMKKCDKNYTYVFELTTPLNRVVCRYDDFSLTLLAVRNNKSLEEFNPVSFIKDFLPFKIKTPQLYDFKNVNHMIQVVREWNPEFHEGVVVKDRLGNRVKVKNPSYLVYNHMRDSLATSFKGCVEVILLGKDDDVMHMMPDVIADRIKALKPAVLKVVKQTESDYEQLKDIETDKAFALKAKDCIWPAALFALRRNKTESVMMFALGNKPDQSKLPSTAIENMLNLCKKVDPSIENLT